MTLVERLIDQLSDIGDVEIVKHVPDYPGYNVGIRFEDDSYLSVPGDTLKKALQTLIDDWRVKYYLKTSPKPTKQEGSDNENM